MSQSPSPAPSRRAPVSYLTSTPTVLDDFSVPVTRRVIVDACTAVRDRGCTASLRFFLRVVSLAAPLLEKDPALVRVALPSAGRCVVIGPVRGHAVDLANTILRSTQEAGCETDAESGSDTPWPAFVFLGDMIDGGQHSVTVLCLVLLLFLYSRGGALEAGSAGEVAVLLGRQEYLCPAEAASIGLWGRFDEELRLLCLGQAARMTSAAETACAAAAAAQAPSSENNAAAVPPLTPEARERALHQETIEYVRRLLSSLPVAAVVDNKYFCCCGGIVPGVSGPDAIEALAKDSDVIGDLVLADPMEDDDEYTHTACLFAPNVERGASWTFSFDAACAFLEANRLHCIIRADAYTTIRGEVDVGCNGSGRPWHFQHSPYDPGFRFYRQVPFSRIPSVLSLFSAPSYLGINRNLAAIAVIRSAGVNRVTSVESPPTLQGSTLHVQQFPAFAAGRVVVPLPGAAPHAFAWSLPLLALHTRNAILSVLFADVPEPSAARAVPTPAVVDGHRRASHAASVAQEEFEDAEVRRRAVRFGRLCLLLRRKDPALLGALTSDISGAVHAASAPTDPSESPPVTSDIGDGHLSAAVVL